MLELQPLVQRFVSGEIDYAAFRREFHYGLSVGSS